MRAETKLIANALIREVKDYVANALIPVTKMVAALEANFAAMPKPERGEQGVAGTPGKDGRDGKDADPKEIEAAVMEALEPRWQAAISVETSIAVAKIPRPENGRDGKDGKDGASIQRDTVALMVIEEVQKAIGKISLPRDGRDGKDGESGRDALHIVPIDGIDHTRSYPRGTWACYRGGLFCAARATDQFEEDVKEKTLADAGWICALDGIFDEPEEYLDEGRLIEKTTIWSSGWKRKTTRIGRSTIYRGIYKPDAEYRKGDEVTWGGSRWHCMADQTVKRPGEGHPDWVLAVKRGDPGKSARNALDGEAPKMVTIK